MRSRPWPRGPAWARALLDSVGRGQIPRRDLSVSIARQLQAFGDRGIDEQLEKVWGKVQPTSNAKAGLRGQIQITARIARGSTG